jgi:predicted GIY-YIG superfamily endonuclease
LVYFESTTDVLAAMARERQIKRWTREAAGVDRVDEPGVG